MNRADKIPGLGPSHSSGETNNEEVSKDNLRL